MSTPATPTTHPPVPSEKPGPSALMTLATIAGGLVALATLLGFVLHGCGHVAYSTYLNDWGVQEGLFPQTADWKVVRGYYAIVLQGSELISDIPWRVVFYAFCGMTIAIFVASLPTVQRTAFHDWFAARPFWIREPVKAMVGSAAVLYVALTMTLIGTLLALIPGWLGERAGHLQAIEEREVIHEKDGHEDHPAELWLNGKKEVSGKIIASSEALIAIYDHDLDLVRTLERAGYEIRSGNAPPTGK
ncbi:hypothetical protein ABIA72_000406 [Stenotrophomonas rhizophila]